MTVTNREFKRYAIVCDADQREAMAKLDQARAGLGNDLGDDLHTKRGTPLRADGGKVQ